ncbi:efflux RND transporter periplasmic adaptor subunit [Ciceribacter sp. L1K23]|uniref:efflux RND transporter periplasmic adaptor subunit n=1 Tax=unclassified Ciceribacter TaxID=2628820 RepID=UPI001ABE5020|nr:MULTISPECIES: efflux RND transporter periplasmic adaptor subunit [unclassified Ciceribacter]MBO3760800.1 efflux RND transporter periplasmic adaptor subunit [Ciceribacter sp. L1K22]MBR0555144.1 efflux RND transporter periplasmic adaptor subunit [Ciceribacter sp. L1K23]
MAFWKQLLLAAVLLVVALVGWLWFVPGSGQTLARLGLPQALVSALGPSPDAATQTGAVNGGQAGANGGRRQGGNAPAVVAVAVETGTVNDRLSAIGSGEAIQSVVVMPQVAGTIEEILVTSGQRVTKGQVLAKLDRDEQVIALDRARVALRSAVERSSSYKNLQSVARLEVLDAQIAEETAKLAVSTAELDLRRRDIVAPIDGVAGIVAVNVGDNVTTQTTVVTIDDRSEILVDFWAPERFAVTIEPGQAVEATSIARPGQVFSGVVDAIDNRVDLESRTIRIRARIDNPQDVLRAGMAFNVSMRFPGETYPSVNPLAVQWDVDGSFVWKVTDEKAQKARVRIVQRNPESVLVEGDVEAGDLVVTEGIQRVREGQAVRLLGGPAEPEVARQ